MHTSTKAETLVKIGSAVVEIFGEIGRFLLYCFKHTNFYTSISGVTEPQFTIFVHDVKGSFVL